MKSITERLAAALEARGLDASPGLPLGVRGDLAAELRLTLAQVKSGLDRLRFLQSLQHVPEDELCRAWPEGAGPCQRRATVRRGVNLRLCDEHFGGLAASVEGER